MHQAWLQSFPTGSAPVRIDVLTLGVTPELAVFPWAAEVHLTAVDASAEMIQNVWPGDTANRKAVLGNWLEMPLPDASFDLILTDTGLALVTGEEKLRALGREFRRVLRKNGRAAMRHFARPSAPESLESIVRATETGQLRNFHELKLRLLMATEAEQKGHGVLLTDVYDCFQRLFPDRETLAKRLGCDLVTIATIEAYRGKDTRYAFSSLTELAHAFDGFSLVPGPSGSYPAAGICPVFSLTPKP